MSYTRAELRGMTFRQQRKEHDDLEKIRAMRELRMLDLMRVALNGDAEEYERYRIQLQQDIDPNAGVTIITLEEYAKGNNGRKR